jgi:hypothetical protein
MKVLIGIDDTDNKDSRGTGYTSRQLASAIENEKFGKVLGITRHQLYVHPEIPYTSQNSSACLEMKSKVGIERLKQFCRNFMLQNAADGSDVGLCIAKGDDVNLNVVNWGQKAKSVVLNKAEAIDLANRSTIYLEGLTGTKDGIIGALAAIGLRKSGNDGRFIWLNAAKNLRNIEQNILPVQFLLTNTGINKVQSIENKIIKKTDKINLNGWARPILKNNKAVLIVEKTLNNSHYEWKCAAKEWVKDLSN